MKNSKSNIIILVLISVMVVFFTVTDDFNAVVKQLATINLWFILISFIFMVIYWLLKSYSVYCLVKEVHKDFKFQQAVQLILRTQFFNAITPFATGGQPYQVYYLKETGINMSKSTGLIIENFIVYQIALVLLGLIAISVNYFGHLFPKVSLLKNLVTLGFMINTFVIIILFVVSFGRKINKKLVGSGIVVLNKLKLVKNKEKTLENWNNYINDFHESAGKLLKKRKLLFKTILINLVALTILYIIPLFILFSFGDYSSFNWYQAIVTSAYVMLIGSFVPIPGGSGGLEYGFVAFYGNFLGGPMLSALMLIWRFVTYYFGLIVGVVSLNLKRVK